MKTKFSSLLLILSILLGILAGCTPAGSKDPEGTNDLSNTGDHADTTTVPEKPMLTLVSDGTSEYVIVRGKNAYISEVTASTELQSYIKQITGVELPIVTDTSAPMEKEIVVGKTSRESEGEFDRDEFGEDGFVIKTKDEKLFLVGGEQRGTLYAVYEFLESYLDCRFYTETIEKVPEKSTLAIKLIEEDKQIPVFKLRTAECNDSARKIITVKRKLNSRFPLPEEYGGFTGWISLGHSYASLVPVQTYYKDHPEYFSIEITDEIVQNGYSNSEIGQICLTNPDVLTIAIEKTRSILREYVEKYPSYTIFSISQNDNQDYCTCDSCTALYELENSYAAATIQFANNIATALQDEFPSIKFETLVYQYTRNAPKTIKPAENLTIRLCTIEECFSHPIADSIHNEWVNTNNAMVKNNFVKDFSDWAAITDNIAIWDYTINYEHGNGSYPNFNVLLQNVRFFAENNVTDIFEENEDGPYTSQTEFNDLRFYILSKILWDPYMSEEEYQYHINDFLEGVYGNGWTHIREYFDLLHEVSKPYCHGPFANVLDIFGMNESVKVHEINEIPEDLTIEIVKNYEDVDWRKYWNFYTDVSDKNTELITRGHELFDKAYESAETEQQKNDIEKLSLQVDFLESCYRKKWTDNGLGQIDKMIKTFLRDKKNGEGLSAVEKAELRTAIESYAWEQVYGDYVDFNSKLLDSYRKFGIKTLSEEIDLGNAPSDW